MEGTYVPPEAPVEPKQDNTLLIVIAIIGGLLLLFCCCCVLAYFFLLAGGPSVGNVFSNIIEGLEMTPVP